MRRNRKSESGILMIEAMVVLLITMLLLVMIMSVGFFLYEKYMVIVATNEAAVKVSDTYRNPNADNMLGFVRPDEMGSQSVFGVYDEKTGIMLNKARTERYIEFILSRSTLGGSVYSVNVSAVPVGDGPFRQHYEIVADCGLKTPFSSMLGGFGIGAVQHVKVSARSDMTSPHAYITEADNANLLIGEVDGDSFTKLLEAIYTVYRGLIDN